MLIVPSGSNRTIATSLSARGQCSIPRGTTNTSCGPSTTLADLSQPLPFTDGAFDDVVASLVLQYLQDGAVPLAEVRRVLIPGGRLILSVDHPAVYKIHPERRLLRLDGVLRGVQLR